MLKKKIKNLIVLGLFLLYAVFLFSSSYFDIFGYRISIMLLIGFILVAVIFFLYINSNLDRLNDSIVQFSFFNENFLKLILLIFLIIAVFIPSIIPNKSIINWEFISFFSYIKTILIILSCAYLPGANIFGIFFKNEEISKRIAIEPFLLKITIYPLISFGFIGSIVIILDQIGLYRELISLFLLIGIFIFFFIDIGFQFFRFNNLKIQKTKIEISKNTIFILLFSFALLTISIGFQIGWLYLVSGDPWDGIKYATQIGVGESSPLFITFYPNFWGYISFGFSALTNLPFINVNTLLAPFSYLFITSVYLFMRSLLFNHKHQYAILSTILVVLFSGLFTNPLIPQLIFVNEFYFIYKSYSYILFFVGLALFFALTNKNSTNGIKLKTFWKKKEFKIIILGSIFLVLSFLTYVFPFILAIIFLFLYCILSEKRYKNQNFRIFIYCTFFIIIIFTFFDTILNFYLSYIIIRLISYYFNLGFMVNPNSSYSYALIVYPIIILSFVFLKCLYVVIFKKCKSREISLKRFNIPIKKIFITISIFFSIFLVIELIFVFLEEFFLIIDLNDISFFFLYLDKIILNIGFIGALSVYFFYYCYNKFRNVFTVLISWIIFSFFLAFALIFIENITNLSLSPGELSERSLFMMDYWFNRIWFYAIPALCIFSSIGLFELFSILKTYRIFQRYKILQPLAKNIICFSLISFSFTGVIFSGILYGNANFRYTKNQINVLDWVSENIPIRSGVLVGDNFFMGVGVDSITFVRQYFFYDIFETELNETQCIQKIEFLKNETVQYVVISQFFISYYLNKSDFTNNILLTTFYNITLYQYGDLSVHYAPYFS